MKYEITKEELETIQTYQKEACIAINQLLETDAQTDIDTLARRK